MNYQLFRFFPQFNTQNFKLLNKVILSNQISGFCGQQHLQSQAINVFDFSNRGSYQTKITYHTSTVGWDFPGMPSHIQKCLNVSEGSD